MKQINDYIMVQNVVPDPICKSVTKQLNLKNWDVHEWYNNETKTWHSNDTKELYVQFDRKELHQLLSPFVIKSLEAYQNKYVQKKFLNQFTDLRFNKYPKGTMMRKHWDHIHSIFDGNIKGVPILSLVGILNDDYEGGNFIFNDTHEIKLNAGDILVFPSNFMYAHEVKEITKGARYSFVSWAF